MTDAATVPGDERLRLFVALLLPESTIECLVAWQEQEIADVQGVRVLPPDHLHVTLAFLGSRPASEVGDIARTVREVAHEARAPALRAYRYRETSRVGMVVLKEEQLPGDAYAGRADMLAGRLMLRLEELGVYRREYRSWLPHVTVARFRKPPRLSPPPPDLCTFSPSEVALYHSVLRPAGAQYEVLELVALGG